MMYFSKQRATLVNYYMIISFIFVRHLKIFRKFDYQASSPDEKALVEGCAKVGFLFTGEKNSVLNIKLQSQRVSKIYQNKMLTHYGKFPFNSSLSCIESFKCCCVHFRLQKLYHTMI